MIQASFVARSLISTLSKIGKPLSNTLSRLASSMISSGGNKTFDCFLIRQMIHVIINCIIYQSWVVSAFRYMLYKTLFSSTYPCSTLALVLSAWHEMHNIWILSWRLVPPLARALTGFLQ